MNRLLLCVLSCCAFVVAAPAAWGTATPPPPAGPGFTVPAAIVGTVQPGNTVTCTYATPGTTVTVQWQDDNVPIAGATSPTYLVATTDENHSLSCEVTSTTIGTSFSVSPATAIPGPPVTGLFGVSISSGPTSVSCGGSFTDSSTPTWGWKRDGVALSTTAQTVDLTAADSGHTFQCSMTGTNAYGTNTEWSPAATVTYTAPRTAAPPDPETFSPAVPTSLVVTVKASPPPPLATAVSQGITAGATCNEACTVTTQIYVTAAQAKQLGLLPKTSKSKAPVLVGQGTKTSTAGGAVTVKVVFTAKAKRALKSAKNVTLSETTKASGASGTYSHTTTVKLKGATVKKKH